MKKRKRRGSSPLLLIVADESAAIKKLSSELNNAGYEVTVCFPQAMPSVLNQGADLLLIDLAASPLTRSETLDLVKKSREKNLPLIALVPEAELDSYDFALGLEDFVLIPYRPSEVLIRVKQALWRRGGVEGGRIIRCEDLAIDLDRYEVTLEGKPVELTFMEYELLRFLAANPGRVFTREALLDRVWGYDYYGGTRTVDVHIRRLRGKIENATHSFIETIRNVGYRFIEKG